MLLPDINVWLAMAFRSHVHHAAAKAWFANLAVESAFFCRMTQQGFLRLASNPKCFPDDAVSMAGAWKLYDALFGDRRVEFVVEPDGVEFVWRSFTHSESFNPKVWNDAYLAAFAQVGAFELVTFDRGIKPYRDVKLTILK